MLLTIFELLISSIKLLLQFLQLTFEPNLIALLTSALRATETLVRSLRVRNKGIIAIPIGTDKLHLFDLNINRLYLHYLMKNGARNARGESITNAINMIRGIFSLISLIGQYFALRRVPSSDTSPQAFPR